MIATLTGKVSEQINETIVLNVHGVGYGLLVSADDWGKLSVGTEATVYIYEHIREQSHDLFGFISRNTKELFEKLLSVNGVGPKMALAILSVGSMQDVQQAISSGDVKLLQSAPGVGKKVAERVVVDLKDKVGLISSTSATAFLNQPSYTKLDDAHEALLALGYSLQDAAQALESVDSSLPLDEKIRQALKVRT
jgi:Holliday junction DNA helicase RuvA